MSQSQQPLVLDLFERLRKFGVPLGVGDYLLAVETLRAGVGLEDQEDFRFTLRLLWAKSLEDQALFDEAFELLVAPALRPRPAPAAAPPPPAGSGLVPERPGPAGLAPSPGPTGEEVPGPVEPEQPEEMRRAILPLRLSLLEPEAGAPEARGIYQLTPRLPIGRREMTGILRHLRRLKREGPEVELDVEGTIDSISRSGYFSHPIMKPRRRNQARLVLLIDCYETMGPFVPVIQALVESARGGGLLGRMNVFYFNYCPDQSLSPHPSLEDPRPTRELLAAYARDSSVLTMSDAGAARGTYSASRAGRIRDFLAMLRDYTYLYAWLNPFPAARWEFTTAEDVARMVPMYPLDRDGLIDAVNILRGRPFPPGIALNLGS